MLVSHLPATAVRSALAVVLAWVLGPLGAAQAGPAAPAAPAQDDGRLWLQRIQAAAHNRSYQGTVVFTGGGVSSSARLQQVCDGPHRYERSEVLDGQHRVLYRHNDQQLTVWPAQRLALKGLRELATDFPALPALPAQHALAHYSLRGLGPSRAAGHEADVLLLQPRDGHRFAQRLWADKGTGLLLRAEVLSPQGEVLESVAFTELHWTAKPAAEPMLHAMKQSMKQAEGLQPQQSPATKTQLEAEGWQLARPVPGFSLLGCTRRPLASASPEAAGPMVLQAVFSDGLAQVSLFVEAFDPARHRPPQRAQQGATHSASFRRGDWWITVVGEVPWATVQQFEHALERRR